MVFWNKDKIDIHAISAPLKTMVEQANILSDVTNDYLQGQVLTKNNNGNNTITFCFTVVAPYLNKSRVTLFCIEQEIDKDFPIKFYSYYYEKETTYNCEDKEAFNNYLKNIISSNQVTDLINGLIAKSKNIV